MAAALKGSTFTNPICPTPSGSDWAASSGGIPPVDNGGGSGLSGSPFSQALVSAPSTGAKETPNSVSGLPTTVATIQVEGTPTMVPPADLMSPRKVPS